MKYHNGVAILALLFTGCTSEAPTADSTPALTMQPARPLDEVHQMRFGNNGCSVELHDGTSLQLYRAREAGAAEDEYSLLVKHTILLDKSTLEPANSEQQPIKELYYTVSPPSAAAPEWTPFPKPYERGELILLVFHYEAPVKSANPDIPVRFKVVGQSDAYTIDGPPIGTIPEVRVDDMTKKLIPVSSNGRTTERHGNEPGTTGSANDAAELWFARNLNSISTAAARLCQTFADKKRVAS